MNQFLRSFGIYSMIALGGFQTPTLYAASWTKHVQSSLQDAAITSNVKEAIAQDELVYGPDISVSTKNGIVYLKGVLMTKLQQRKTIKLAQHIKGVKSVDSLALKVAENKSPMRDAAITADINTYLAKQIIKRTSLKAGTDIEVETHDGKVYMTGAIASKKQKQALLQYANHLPNVKKVYNDIEVKIEK